MTDWTIKYTATVGEDGDESASVLATCDDEVKSTLAIDSTGIEGPARAVPIDVMERCIALYRKKNPKSKAPKVDDAPDQDIETVLMEMKTALQSLNPKAKGPRDTAMNRKLIRAPMKACGATAHDWSFVIDKQLASVRNDPEKHKYLSLATLGIPRNFQRVLDMADAPEKAQRRLLE
jgi:hypothetical protein